MLPLRSNKGRVHRLVLWLLVAIVTIGATLIAFFPASWMAALVESRTQGRLTLGDAQGSLWHGSAFLGAAASREGAVTPLLPGRFSWRLSPLVLLGSVKASVENPAALTDTVHVEGSWNAWRVSPGAVMLPAERLTGLGAPLNTIQPSGQMKLSWGPLQIERQGNAVSLVGKVNLELQDVASRLSPVKPLGAYLLSFDWHGQAAQVQLKSLKGPMLLSGGGSFANGRMTFSGKAEAAPGQEERLANLLNLLGQRRMEGNKTVIALELR